MADPGPLDDDDLLSILRKEEQSSRDYQTGTLADQRLTALKYYDREGYGDEQEGASSVVTSEFSDTVESVMPGLMEVFTGSDQVVQFVPSAPGEEKIAQEATDYVTHCFMVENDGFTLLHSLIKDALMFRLGGMSIDLAEKEEIKRIPVEGMPQDAIDVMVSEAANEPNPPELTMELTPDPPPEMPEMPGMQVSGEGFAPQPMAPPGLPPPPQDITAVTPETPGNLGMPVSGLPAIAPPQTFSGTVTFVRKVQKVAAASIAPADIRFTPDARTQDEASFLGFVKRVTSSDLVKLGMSQDEVDDLRSDHDDTGEEDSTGTLYRSERDTVGDSERPLWLVVAYLRADADGDGISEMLRVVYAHSGGAAGRILEREEWEDGVAPIALATPILMPHALVGRSLFDQTQDLQLISSVLTRGMLDNLYMSNRPRPAVSDAVILDSLLDWVPGSPIRFKAGAKPGDGHIDWQKVPSIMSDALTALEYFQTVKENRTGTGRQSQGIQGDDINKTARGMNLLMSASAQRQKLIARVLAETAVARIYRLVYRALKRAALGPTQYWAGKTFKTVDPSKWPDDMSLTVNVGLGTGNTQQELEHLQMIAMAQEKLVLMQGGANGPYVTPENIANTSQKLAEKLGFKTPGMFFQPPEQVEQQIAQQAGQPKPPPPEVQAEQAKTQGAVAVQQAQLEGDLRQLQAEAAVAEQKARVDMELKSADMQIKREEMMLKREEMELKRLEMDLKREEMEHKRGEMLLQSENNARDQFHQRRMARIDGPQGEVDGMVDGANGHADDAATSLALTLKELIAQQRESAQAMQQALAIMAADSEVTGPSGKVYRSRKVPR
jgi:hypothetical protein